MRNEADEGGMHCRRIRDSPLCRKKISVHDKWRRRRRFGELLAWCNYTVITLVALRAVYTYRRQAAWRLIDDRYE